MRKVESFKYIEDDNKQKQVVQSHVDNDHHHSNEHQTPEKFKNSSFDRGYKQRQGSFDQFNRIQFHEETFPQDSNYERNFDNSKMSEYSLQSIEREDMVEDRVNNHTLHKSIHVYSKFISSASHQLNMQQKPEPDPEKLRIAMDLLNALNPQQEVEPENLNDIEYEKITRRHAKLIKRNTMKDPYYVRLVKLSEFQRLNYELQKYNDNLPLLNLRKSFIYLIHITQLILVLDYQSQKNIVNLNKNAFYISYIFLQFIIFQTLF